LLKSVQHPLVESAVCIDPPVAQKWPVGPLLVYAVQFDIGDYNLFSID